MRSWSNAELAEKLLPWGRFELHWELQGGSRNRVYLAESEATLWVVKSTRRSESALAWLAPVQAAARQAGFVVPAYQRTRAGNLSANGLTLEPFLEGELCSREQVRDVTPQLEELHRRTFGMKQRPGAFGARNIDLTHLPFAVVRLCREALRLVKQHPRSAIHGDVHAGNLLRLANGETALLDWDEARVDATVFDTWPAAGVPGDAEQRALDAWEIAVSWESEPDYARRLAARWLE